MLKWINKKRDQKGFTLIELVVVIAILGILMALAVPRFSGFTSQAKMSTDKASAATIAKAIDLYIASNSSTNIPTPKDLVEADLIDAKTLVPKYKDATNKGFSAVLTNNQAVVGYASTATTSTSTAWGTAIANSQLYPEP